MLKFLIVTVCFAAANAASISVNPFLNSAASIISPKGNVTFKKCGGVGTSWELRVSGCEGSCFLYPGTEHLVELDMTPAYDAPSLHLKMTTELSGQEILIKDDEILNSSVQAGQRVTLRVKLTPNDYLSGKQITIKSVVTHSSDGREEICITNDVFIV